jgi:hypothetical protein
MTVGSIVKYNYRESDTDYYTNMLTKRHLIENNYYTVIEIANFSLYGVHYRLMEKTPGDIGIHQNVLFFPKDIILCINII